MSYPTVWDRFEHTAQRFSSLLAASDLSRDITYSELADLAGRIAHATTAAAGRPGPVAILLASEARLPAAMLGVLAAARPYLPLNPEHSIERNRSILIHSGATAVISAGEFARQARAVLPAGLTVIDLDDIGDRSRAEPRRPRPEDLAQIIYTSGSTGMPKGVAQDHRGLLYAVELRIGSMQMCSEDRVAFAYAPGIAAGTLHMLSSLLSGASLHVLRPQQLMGAGLAREMRNRGITAYHSVPTLFRRIVATLGPGERLGDLRIVRLGGERIDWSDVDAFRRACEPGARLVIGASSTETGLYAEWLVDETLRPTSRRLPVGRPVPGYRVAIVQEDGRPAPDGQAGELVVAGRYIALGYWNEPGLTRRAFDGDPANPRSRTFRTGDLGRRRPDGLLEFLGRKDDQIKLRGHRIELGEVEAALRRCAGIRDAAVVVRRTGAGIPLSLIGYAEPLPGTLGLLPRHVMAMVSRFLPREMMPSEVVLLHQLPRLPSLKLDRVKLAEMHALRSLTRSGEGPGSIVNDVVAVFNHVLGIEGARPEDGFRSLGGDSLQGVEAALELERRLGIVIPPGRIEASGSIRDLAEWIGSHMKRGPLVRSSEAPPDPAPLANGIAAAFRGGRRVDLTGHRWQPAVDLLVTRGDLEAAEYAVRRVHAAHPELPYPRNLCEVFDHLPASGAQPTFNDDPTKDIQVVRNGNADAALLLFCGIRHRFAQPLSLIHRWLGCLPAHLIYLRDFRRLFFMAGFSSLGGDREVALCELRKIISSLGARRLLCCGGSAGAFAALHYGLHLNAESVLALSGPTNLSAEFNTHLNPRRSAARLRTEVRVPDLEMSRAYAAAKRRPRVCLVYGDSHWDDRLQAEDMAGLSDVVLRPLENFEGHNTVQELIRRGLFDQQLRFLVDS